MSPWLFVVLSYLIGAIPASYVAGRMAKGIDLREHGSGNLGATNTFRVLDFGQWDGSNDWRWALAYGAAAIVGHVFSIYMHFKGGKGVATSAGVFLGLAPLALGIGLLVWLLVLRGTRMVSAASIAAALAVGVALPLTPVPAEVRVLGYAVVAFVIFSHRSNVARILNGTEPRFGKGREPRATVAAAAVTADAEKPE